MNKRIKKKKNKQFQKLVFGFLSKSCKDTIDDKGIIINGCVIK